MEEFLAYLKEQGWKIAFNEKGENCLPQEIEERYAKIPQSWREFISGIRSIENADDTTWFLCEDDFKIRREHSFQWNEWEIISLNSAENDVQWEAEIKEFWNHHFPIILSVKNGYSYYAISMENGSVVYGAEPEFEVCETVAPSFEEFLRKIIKGEILI